MPYEITINDLTRIYTVTTPNWFCEWIVYTNTSAPVKRQCYLKHDTLDISDADDAIVIHGLLPELVKEIDLAFQEWNTAGDPTASSLLTTANIPAYLAYAKQALLSDINR